MEAMDGMPKDWRQWRRFQALRLKRQGWFQRHIAQALNVSEVSVSHWCTSVRRVGIHALVSHPPPGHQAALSPTQLRMIPEFLWHGPEAYGFRGQLWICGRVAKVIEEEFGVAYNKGHVARLLNG
jgi:transposase